MKSHPTPIANASSQRDVQRKATGDEADPGAPRSHPSLEQRMAEELAYGCVDWFQYGSRADQAAGRKRIALGREKNVDSAADRSGQ
jgi:hypothetical protein